MQILKKILQSNYLMLCLFLLIILISYYRTTLVNNSFYKGDELEFKLEVVDKKYKENKYTVTLLGKEKLISYIDNFPYNVGDIILVKGSLSKPKNNTIPNTFNYYKYLQSRGILWELKISESSLVKRNSSLINKLKSFINNRINNNKYKEYLYIFLLGDSSYFSNDKRDIYEVCGLTYLISIGSLQIMMIVKLLKIIEGKMKLKKNKSLIINTIFIILYILFTNKIIGVLRSGLCYILSSILKHYKIKYKYQNIICIIGIILLIINPYYIISSGFLYSFTISLIISLNIKIIKGNYFKRLIIISTFAFISSLPITIYLNYEINFLTIIYSLFFVPIFHFIIFPLSIIVFIISYLSPIYYFIISFIEYIIKMLSKIIVFVFIFRNPSMILVIVYYIVIIFTINKKRLYLLIILLIFHYNINSLIREKLVTILDVSEGDSIVLKNNNHLFLIDTSGNSNYSYSDNIIKYIKSLGINKIDSLILTHGDLDHCGETINLVNDFKVEKVIFNCGSYTLLEKEIVDVLNIKKIPYYSCINKLDNIYFLQTDIYNSENDNSNVIYTELDGYKLLFMADAESSKEKDILDKYSIENIDILKVGHHGSKTSSTNTFINKINPKYSVISVGRNNIYHHPNKEVLNNLSNSKIYRTDKEGSIVIKINNKLNIETYPP